MPSHAQCLLSGIDGVDLDSDHHLLLDLLLVVLCIFVLIVIVGLKCSSRLIVFINIANILVSLLDCRPFAEKFSYNEDDQGDTATAKAVEAEVVEGHLGVLGALDDDAAGKPAHPLAKARVGPASDAGESGQRSRSCILFDELRCCDLKPPVFAFTRKKAFFLRCADFRKGEIKWNFALFRRKKGWDLR